MLLCGAFEMIFNVDEFGTLVSVEDVYKMGVESLEIPEGVQTIGEGVFANFINLKEVKFPKSLKKIDKGAFLRNFGSYFYIEISEASR